MSAAARFLERLAAGDAEALAAERVVVVAAHPDDETIGFGGQLALLSDVRLIHVTDGAPRNLADAASHGFATAADYAAARRRELAAAMTLSGIGTDRMTALDVPDQEACFHLAEIAQALAADFAQRQPSVVVTHPYEGGHPDHDAVSFAVAGACRLQARRGGPVPAVVEMTAYHNRDGRMAVYAFLPDGGAAPITLDLPPAARERKRRMLDCFTTQAAVLAQFPVAVERLRPVPPHDYARPPHPGTLLYETFGWAMTGERWRVLAAEAGRRLGLDEAA